MAPINIEIAGSSFTAQNKETKGVSLRFTNLAIAYSGTEDGGRAVIALEKNIFNPISERKPCQSHEYDKELIVISQGQEPVEKNIEYTSINSNKKTTKIKITAL